MNIPNQIKIGGKIYTVEYLENLNNGVNMCYGHIDYEKARIELEKK